VRIARIQEEWGMKRLLIAVVLGGTVFAAVFAAAATLGLTSDNLGSGDQVVASCATGVNVTYQTSYQASLGRYRLDTITLQNLTAQCDGQTITATLTGPSGGNNPVGAVTTELCCDGGTTAVLAVTGDVNPEDVTGVHVVITGVAGT
jgi:hypothetical protein